MKAGRSVESTAAAPAKAYLEDLRWDGQSRIGLVLTEILRLHAKPFYLYREMVRKFFVGAVARQMQPGCRLDTALVFRGPQGAGKSRFFRTISEPWFVDTAIDLNDKDAFTVTASAWLVEWAEFENAEIDGDTLSFERIKAFLSSVEDVFRPPHGKRVIHVPRTVVVCGTTCADAALSMSRRVWVIPTGDRIDIAKATEWRSRLWAEAVHLWRSGHPWWLTSEENDRADAARRFFDDGGAR